MPYGRSLRDKLLKVTGALPASTTASVSGTIDLESGSRGDFVAEIELLISVPVLTITQLPDTKTMTYTLESDDNSSFSSAKIVCTFNPLTQTGATGGSATAATTRYVPASDSERYLRVKATPAGSGTGDCSAATMTVEVLS